MGKWHRPFDEVKMTTMTTMMMMMMMIGLDLKPGWMLGPQSLNNCD